MEWLPYEIKLLYCSTPVILGTGIYAGNPVLICGGLVFLAMIAYRWRPGAKKEKRRIVND